MHIINQIVARSPDFFFIVFIHIEKAPALSRGFDIICRSYLTWYITSFTNFTVRGTSGKAAATRLGA